MERCTSEMELVDATAIAGLLKSRFEEAERCYNSRTYRCGLHVRAILRRPATVRFHWQGILRELSGVEVRRFSTVCSTQSADLMTRETEHFEFGKEPNDFTHLNNDN
ncbi:MAG: hypothetical protein DME48_13890 [Verrucomicrobia bacterium]|nr:MAG: hypothetical protein DME48_13890 [Verrucomicrobiota bacterium]